MGDLTTLLLVALCCFFSFVLACSGYPLFHILLSPSFQPHQLSSVKEILVGHVKSVSRSVSFAQTRSPQMHEVRPSLAPSKSPAPPAHQAYAPSRSSAPSPRHQGHRHRHHMKPVVVAPSPSEEQSCDQICVEPLTATPFGSPCGCVFPMKVRLLLNMAPYAIFPVMNELEIEVAVGAYLEQSQVKIMGASADSEDQGKTVVEINLVPLGEKFDNTTAVLTADRFWNKKLLLNATFFGTYEVISIIYPGSNLISLNLPFPSLTCHGCVMTSEFISGIPSSPPYPNYNGSGPSINYGDLPMTANFANKNQRMNARTIAIISLSAFVVLLVLIGAFAVVIRWRETGRPSSAIDPAFGSSVNKRSGIGSFLSSGIASSASASLMSTTATCLLSVKKFEYYELEKATEKFSSKWILGEGGFGCVYRGTMEDGIEVAVKLLTRNHRSGDQEFIAEVEMLSRLHHRNLVKLIGICIEGCVRCLVYELIGNGSVESHLHGVDKTKSPLDWDPRLKIALGAARGLAYLHEDSNPRVIHRDFKASNVLLEDDFTPKVSDFGLAREATEGSHHISTRVMGTFGYVAPEYAMTGHLLVKSDVYSYGVVLLELLTGRKPVDMSQPQGQENLVTWARPLLTNREGLEQLVDPCLAGSYNIDDMAKVASIASMCVHPEVTNRPFMGEVVQALKLIYNDTDETCGDYCSQKESSVMDSDFKGELAPSESSWWNAGGVSPRLSYGQVSSFITMEYNSDPLEELDNRPFSASSLAGDPLSLGMHGNRSGPLRTARSKPTFYRLRGSMSEHELLSRRAWNDGNWV